MVAVVAGSGAGVVNTSRELIGQAGQWGQSAVGRGADQVTVNASNGNLVVQNRDEFLIGVGSDINLLRTYNSQGAWDGDNADNWRIGYYRRVAGLTGTVNTLGSTIKRIDADGFESTYSFDVAVGKYVGKDGAGAYDTLAFSAATGLWTWTDGDSGSTESYAQTSTGGVFRLTQVIDVEGHAVKIGYDAAGLITTVSSWRAGASNADETITLVYDSPSTKRLTQTVTSYTNESGAAVTRTRVRYEYDADGRLQYVRTDLTPEDNSIADNRAYWVRYGYDTAGRVNSITQNDGSVLSIEYDANGRVSRWTDALGRSSTLAYDTANRKTTITDALGQASVMGYSSTNHLLEVSGSAVGGAAFKHNFTYDIHGNLTSSINALGEETVFAYSGNGALTRRTDAAGNVLERTYDGANRLIAETLFSVPDPDGSAGAASASGAQTTRYVYDTSGGKWRLRFTMSPEGRVTQHAYNSLGQRSTSTTYSNNLYSAGANPTLSELSAWAGGLSAADRSQAEQRDYAYDLRGQLVSVKEYAGTSISGSTVSYTTPSEQRYVYDAFGRLLQSIDAVGNSTVFAYDGLNRLTLSRDALNASTVYSYDDSGNRSTVTLVNGQYSVSQFNAAGQLISNTSYNSADIGLGATRYAYDALDRLRMVEDPTGTRNWTLYDTAGRKTADINGLGRVVEYAYDAAGRLVQSLEYATALSGTVIASLTDRNGQPTAYTLAEIRPTTDPAKDRLTTRYYDAAGRLTGVQDGAGYLTETLYDGASRVLGTISYATAGVVVRVNTSAGSTLATPPVLVRPVADATNDRRTRNLYGNDGLLQAALDAEGHLIEWEYDGAGRRIAQTSFYNATLLSERTDGTLGALRPARHAQDQRSIYLYDNQGRLAAELDAEGYLTEYKYDLADRSTGSVRWLNTAQRTVTVDGTGAVQYQTAVGVGIAQLRPLTGASETTTRTYTALGLLDTEQRPDGVSTKSFYDNLGRLSSTVRAHGSADSRTNSIGYDGYGRVQTETDGQGKVQTHTYDSAGRRASTTDARGNTTYLYYDSANRLVYSILKTALGGEVRESRYNVFGEAETQVAYTNRLAVADTNALVGGLTNETLAAKVAALASATQDNKTQSNFNQRGQIQQAIDALGHKTDYNYNAFGQIESSFVDTVDLLRLRSDYAYDRQGRLRGTTADASGLNVSTGTEYDAFGRTIASIDARGNRSTIQYLRNDGTPDGGRKMVLTDPAGAARTTTYDAFDRVVQQTDALGQSVRFVHDVANRRVTMTTAQGIVTVSETTRHGQIYKLTDGTGASTTYAYDKNGNLLTVADALGNITTRSYDESNNLLSLTTGLKDVAGMPTADGSAVTTSYTYDAASRVLTSRLDPNGSNLLTSYQYDGQGRTVRRTDADGTVTSYVFDAKGQLRSTIVDDVAGGLRLTTSTSFDAQGRVLTYTEGAGSAAARTTEYRYDVLGRRTHEIVDPAGLSLTTTYGYDKSGNVVLRRDALGHATRYVYDDVGRMQYTIRATGSVAERLYDVEGRLIGEKDYAQRLSENNAVRLWYQAGTNSSLSRSIGRFSAGDVVTATVRYKAEGTVTASMLLGDPGGADPYDNSNYTLQYGSRDADGWQTLTLTHTMSHDDDMWVYLYGDRDGLNAQAGNSVLYDDVQVTSTLRGSVLEEGFETDPAYGGGGANWSISGPTAQRTLTDIALSPALLTDAQIRAAIAGLADVRDQVTQYVYDNDGRQTYAIDAEGGVTRSQYDAAGRVVISTRYATVQTGTWNAARSPVVDAAKDQSRYTVYDAGGRARYSVDTLNYVSESIYDRGGRVVATKRYARTITRPVTLTEANVAAALSTRLDPANDRVEFHVYDAAGRQRFKLDAEGYATEQQLDAMGRVTATLRHASKHSYSTAPTLAQIVNGVDAQTASVASRQYDAAGRLVLAEDAEGVLTRYVYDDVGRVTHKTVAHGTAQASTTHYAYDGDGRVVEETRAFGTAAASTTRHRYDANGRLIATIDPRGVAEAAAGGLPVTEQSVILDRYATRYGYDALGQRTVVIDPLGGTTTTGYDTFGNAVEITDARGHSGYFAFDRANRNTLYVDPEGYAVTNRYDAFGNKVGTTQHANRAVGTWSVNSMPVVASTAPGTGPYVLLDAGRDAIVAFAFDRLNRLTQRTDAENVSGTSNKGYEVWTYDAFGNKSTYRNKVGGVYAYQYDRRGLLTRETLPITTKAVNGATVAVVNRNVYDARGNRIQAIEAEGAAEQRTSGFLYDGLDRLVLSTGQALTTYQVGVGYVSGVVPTTTISYDGRGNVIAQTDANGNRTAWYYDVLNRKVGEVSASGTLSIWEYDQVGNAVVQKIYGDPVALPAGTGLPVPSNISNVRETQFGYDANNRQIESRIVGLVLGRYDEVADNYHAGAPYGLDKAVVTKKYDATGNLIKLVDGNGGVTYTFYDRAGQKILEVDPEGYGVAWAHGQNGVTTRETRFARRHGSAIDETGNAAALVSSWPADPADRITDFSYDRAFRLISETRLNVAYSSVASTSGSLTHATAGATRSYIYDGLDNKVRETDANGRQSDWVFDAAGRRIREQLPGFADFEGAAVRSTTDYEYNGLNAVSRVVRRGKDNAVETDDQITSYTYGIGGRLDAQTDAKGQVTQFGYDAAGNLTLRRYDRRDADNAVATEGSVHAYDAMNREVSRQSVSQLDTPTWQYGDKNETRYSTYGEVTGRRTNGGNVAGEWQEYAEYNALGKVVKSNSDDGITKAYLYDANGNATLSIESAGADLRPLTLDQILARTDVHKTITLFDSRNQISSVIQPTMVAARELADVRQFTAQQVTLSPGGGGQINNVGAMLSTQATGSAQAPMLTDAQRFQSISTAVNWNTTGYSDSEGGYVYTGTKLNSVKVNLSVPSIGAHVGAWTFMRVRIDYRVTGGTSLTGAKDIVITDRNATSATVNLGLTTGVGNTNLSYTVTASFGYAAAPEISVGSAQFGGPLTWTSNSQVSDGEGGYTSVVQQNFAAAAAFNGAFKTSDLGAVASSAPSAFFSVWQDKVGGDLLSSTVSWNPSSSDGEGGYTKVTLNGVTVGLPTSSFQQTFGNFVRAVVYVDYDLSGDAYGTRTNTVTITNPATTSVYVPINYTTTAGNKTLSHNVRVAYYWANSNKEIQVATAGTQTKTIAYLTTRQVSDGEGGYITETTQNFAASNAFNRSFYADTSNKTFFVGGSELLNANEAYLYYRTSTSAPYSMRIVPRAGTLLSDTATSPANPAGGIFYVWNSWLPAGIVDYKLVAMSAGAITASYRGSSIGSTLGLTSESRSQVGQVFFDSNPAIHFFDQATPRLSVQYRRTGTTTAWTTVEISAYETGGWFSWNWQAAGLSGQYDMRVLRMNSAGSVTARMFTRVNLTTTPTATAPVPYSESDIVLTGQPTNASSLSFRYRLAGSTGAFTTTSFANRGGGSFGRNFQADNLLPVVTASSQYDYEYQYDARDAGGQVVNSATGTFRVTPNAKTFLSHNSTRLPTMVPFTIDDADALRMDVRYRAAGSTGAFTAVPRLSRASNAVQFEWNASAITPATGTASFEYEYRLYDAAGNAVLNPLGDAIVVVGTVTVGTAPTQAATTGWVITGIESTTNTIRRYQTHNAFGEIETETDGRGNTTDLAYNTLGSLILRRDPTTDITGENGVTTRARPETRWYYDRTGKALATRDANGFVAAQLWNDGLAQAQVAKEFHADGGKPVNSYDVFGNLRSAVDAEGRQTRYSYDKNNQLIQLDRPTRAAGQYLQGQGATETYEYDVLGNRIATTNELGRARTYFDLEGRVSKVTSIEGRSTTYAYTYHGNIATIGGLTGGGWQKVTTMIGGKVSYENNDVFGRMTYRQDFGGHRYTYGYNHAGWLTQQSSSLSGAPQQSLSYEYYNNGYLKRQTDNVYHVQTDYTYDANGNRVFEGYKRTDVAGGVYANSAVTYDELNRVKTVVDPKYEVSYKYDAVGNRRNVLSYYNDGLDGDQQVQDYWYLYDGMNRFTLTMGKLEGGVIQRGTTGKLISYNLASERMSAEYEAAGGQTYRERYTYTSDGYLQDMFLSTWTAGAFVEQSEAAASRSTDLAGRVVAYAEHNADNSVRTNLARSFDRDNRQTQEVDYTKPRDGQYKTDTYAYNADGTLATISTSNVATTITLSYAYQWWDSAKQTEIRIQAVNDAAPRWAPGTSKLTYDLNGNLYRATDVAGKRTIQYVTDGEGQILFRQELAARQGVSSDWDSALLEVRAGDAARKRNYYYLNGHRIGDVSNEGTAPSQVDYAEALAQAKNVSNDARNKKFRPTAYANFDENYQPINAAYPGIAPTEYTVQSGDSLQGIAATVWGDRALWYLIADANGMSGSEALSEGMRLVIPNKVANLHNNAGTFKVYDAGEAIGDTSPTLPPAPPPPSGGCGSIGTIIMIVVAVVVTIYTAGAASTLLAGGSLTGVGATMGAGMTVLSGGAAIGAGGVLGATAAGFAGAAIGGAVGSIASQGFAMAAGMQDSFSWKQVGVSALGTGITAGVGSAVNRLGIAALQGSGPMASAGRAGVSSGISQAAQGEWNWRNVTASVVGAGVGAGVGGALGSTLGPNASRIMAGLTGGVAGQLAGPGGRVNFSGILGSTLGNALGDSMARGSASGSESEDVLGEFIKQQEQAQDTRDTYRQLVASFGQDYEADRSSDLLFAASGGAGRSGEDRLEVGRSLTDQIKDAEAVLKALDQRDAQAKTERRQDDFRSFEIKQMNAASPAASEVAGSGLTIRTSFPLPAEQLPEGGFFRGLVLGQSGSSVLDAHQPGFAENLGAGVRGLVLSPINTVTGLISEVGSQYSDTYNLLTRSESFTPSSALLSSLQREGIGGTLLNMGYSVGQPVFDLLEGRYEQAGAGLPGTLAAGFGLARGVRLGGDAPFSPIAPGGGLMSHELAGGHLLLKHIGQTERQLLDRLVAEPHITGSSSFYDRPTAEAAVSSGLNARQADISAWLATSKPQMRLEYTLQNPVGISVGQGMSSAADASSLRLILRRDVTMPTGYRIHTGFPIQ